jgi:hypothetical protein
LDILEEKFRENLTNEDVVNELMEIITELNPDDYLDNIPNGTPFFEAIDRILKNLALEPNLNSKKLEELSKRINELTPVESVQEVLEHVPVVHQGFEHLPHNSMAFVLLTLIETMAASSKMGLGTEDTVCIIDGARDFAKALFRNEEFIQMSTNLIKMFSKGARAFSTPSEKVEAMQALMPFNFAIGVLLDATTKEDFLKKNKNKPLARNLSDFEQMQSTEVFGNCLTKVAQQSARFYKNFLNNSENVDNCPFLFEEKLTKDLGKDAAKLAHDCKEVIRNNIENSSKHITSQSYNWFRVDSPFSASSDESSDKRGGSSPGKN